MHLRVTVIMVMRLRGSLRCRHSAFGIPAHAKRSGGGISTSSECLLLPLGNFDIGNIFGGDNLGSAMRTVSVVVMRVLVMIYFVRILIMRVLVMIYFVCVFIMRVIMSTAVISMRLLFIMLMFVMRVLMGTTIAFVRLLLIVLVRVIR